MKRCSRLIIPVALGLLTGLAPLSARAQTSRPGLGSGAPASPQGARPPRTPAPVQGSCNINAADATQLAVLPGIGPVRAQAIIAHRQKQPFRTVEDLVKVKGIGRKTFARLRPYLAVSGATTIARVKAPVR